MLSAVKMSPAGSNGLRAGVEPALSCLATGDLPLVYLGDNPQKASRQIGLN